MDWTILPPPDPKSSSFEAEVPVDVWDEFVVSADFGDTDSQRTSIESVIGTGCFDTINMNLNGDGNHTVDYTLTAKGIRILSDAHQQISKVSVSSCLPESLRELSVEELSERVLESGEDYDEFSKAISSAQMTSRVRKMPHFDHRDHPYLDWRRDHIHLNF